MTYHSVSDIVDGQELQTISIHPTATARSERTRATEPLQLAFRNLRFTVPAPNPEGKGTVDKTILDGVTGVIQPGRLTVILGSSGAGKTSLLNVLAGESACHAGRVTGELLVNGQSTSGREIRKLAGYVYQDDIIYTTMTVREAVTFAARLRIPRTVPDAVKRERVEDLLAELHLTRAADTLIGDDRIKGVSGGERKRASIAMELVTNPGVLFLDEPTSGLDTYTALTVVRFLKQLAKAGHTVVATLHQPSSDIFHLIDDLMLMAEGRVLYLGAADRAVSYFTQHGYHCPQYSNPADFFFMSIFHQAEDTAIGESGGASTPPGSKETVRTDKLLTATPASSAGLEERTREEMLSDVAAAQAQRRQLLDLWPTTPEGAEVQRAADTPRSGGFSNSSRKYRSSFREQFPLILHRTGRNAIRDKLALGAKVGQMLVFGILFDLIFWQLPDRAQSAQIQDRWGILFFYATIMVMSTAMGVLTVFTMERATFLRENRSGMYGLPAFFFGKILVEIPIHLFTPVILLAATYWAVGLNANVGRFFITCLICMVLSGSGMGIGIAAASLFNDVSIALTVLPTMMMPMMLFGGLFSNIGSMPAWVSWLQWLSLIKYGFVALAKNEFEGAVIGCGDAVPAAECVSVSGESVIESLGMAKQGSVWLNIGAMLAWWAFFMALAYFGFWRLLRGERAGRPIKKAA